MNNLYNDYCDCPSCRNGLPHIPPALELSSNNDKTLFKRILNVASKAYSLLYNNRGYKAKDIGKYQELIDETNKVFKQAISKGIQDNVIPRAMRTALNEDVFVFSALKTHAQLFEASRLLTDKNGKIKPFYKFKEDIQKIEKDYNEHYLRAEYNFATSSARQAANWAKVEENKGRYNLQYRTAKDDKVRDSHATLDEITLPVEDKFWNSYYPPNGWNCRCVAVEVLKGKYEVSDSEKAMEKGDEATMQIGKDGKNRMEIFRFNPGKEKVVFPPNHPYRKLQGADYIKDLKYRDFVFKKPLEKQYSSIYNSSTGGKVLVHDLADIKHQVHPSDDYIDRIATAKTLARQGKVVRVMPEINIQNMEARKQVFKGLLSDSSNPDFKIGNKYFDLKRPSAFKNILNNANRASNQGGIVVISDSRMKKELSSYIMKEQAKLIFNSNYYQFNEVIFKKGNKLYTFNRTGGK